MHDIGYSDPHLTFRHPWNMVYTLLSSLCRVWGGWTQHKTDLASGVRGHIGPTESKPLDKCREREREREAPKEHIKQWKWWQWGEGAASQDNNVPFLYMWPWPGGHKHAIYSHPDLLELQRPNLSVWIYHHPTLCSSLSAEGHRWSKQHTK